MELETRDFIYTVVGDFFVWSQLLLNACVDETSLGSFFYDLGWGDGSSIIVLSNLQALIEDFRSSLSQISELPYDETIQDPSSLVSTIVLRILESLNNVRNFSNYIATVLVDINRQELLDDSDFLDRVANELYKDLINFLNFIFLRNRSPSLLILSKIVQFLRLERVEAIEWEGKILRFSIERPFFDLESFYWNSTNLLKPLLPDFSSGINLNTYLTKVGRNFAEQIDDFIDNLSSISFNTLSLRIDLTGISILGEQLLVPPERCEVSLPIVTLSSGDALNTKLIFSNLQSNAGGYWKLEWSTLTDILLPNINLNLISFELLKGDISGNNFPGLVLSEIGNQVQIAIDGGVKVTTPYLLNNSNGSPLTFNCQTRIAASTNSTIAFRLNQIQANDSERGFLFSLPGIPDLGINFYEIDEVMLSVGQGISVGDEFEIRVSVSKFGLRLPNLLFKPVIKGFKLTSHSLIRLRKTTISQKIIEQLSEALLDQEYRSDQETEFLEIVDSSLSRAGFTGNENERDRLRKVVLSYAVNFVKEVGENSSPIFREILIDAPVTFSINSVGNLEIITEIPSISLKPVMLGQDSNIVIEADNVELQLSGSNKGLTFTTAKLYLPPDIPAVPDLTITDCFIGQSGFTGKVSAEWVLDEIKDSQGRVIGLDGEVGDLFGFQGGLSRLAIDFKENWPLATDIRGKILISSFDGVLDIRIEMQGLGKFVAVLAAADEEGVTLTKEELIKLNFKSLAIAYPDPEERASLTVSGGLEPLLMNSEGLKWPRLDVTDLTIQQNPLDLTEPPILKFKEAWLDLKDLATLDLWGFHFELNRLGIGYEQDRDRLWLDLTGNIQLIQQIPMGFGVEGFRLTWPRVIEFDSSQDPLQQALAIANQLEVKFDGIYLIYGVPGAVEFEGLIRFIKEAQKVGFLGDIALRVPSTGFGLEAGLLIGMNFEEPPYPFLYVSFGVDLPTGIPLGQSGLALKGAQGLFGLNVVPTRKPEENWYYDWYKVPKPGAHQAAKWRDQRMAIAFGAGVTITTVDGYIKGVRALLVLSFPGPILVLEGRGLIFDGLLPAEPPLRALAVFDGNEKTVQFNIEAEAELVADLIRAYGMLEAFFDFEDLTNWHLYLGQDDPSDRRIRAGILKFKEKFLFDANAYLMVDMIGQQTLRTRMGVFVGFEPTIPDFGPVRVKLKSVLEGDGEVTVLPEQFSGNVNLTGNVELSAFGFGVQLSTDAGIASEGPNPFTVDVHLNVRAELPAPLEPFEAELSFSWETPRAPKLVSPLAAATADSNFVPGGGALQLYEYDESANGQVWRDRRQAAETAPIVPLDTRPTLDFSHDINDDTRLSQSLGSFARDPDSRVNPFEVGILSFTPGLRKVRLYEHRKGQAWAGDESDWKLIASSDGDDWQGIIDHAENEIDAQNAKLWGVWLADASPEDPTAPAARRLRLWTTDPLIHARGALGSGYASNWGMVNARISHPEWFLATYPDYFTCRNENRKLICVSFGADIAPKGFPRQISSEETWIYQGITFTASQGEFTQSGGRIYLVVNGDLHIQFPETVGTVEINLVGAAGLRLNSNLREWLSVYRTARSLAEFKAILQEAESKGAVPDLHACRFQVELFSAQLEGNKLKITLAEGFNCLHIKAAKFRMSRICYHTKTEMEQSDRTDRLCNGNKDFVSHFGEEAPLLKPGSYYRMVVESVMTSTINRLPANSPFNLLNGLYEKVLEALTGSADGDTTQYNQETFFQTESPPHNLSRYIKWSSPQHQSERVFRGDDLLIRFLRPNIKVMFANPQHALRILVRDAEGNTIEPYSRWGKARTASLLPEEQVWHTHLNSQVNAPNVDSVTLPADDILSFVRSDSGSTLKPKARYEMLVVGGEGGELLWGDRFSEPELQPIWEGDTSNWSVDAGSLKHTSNTTSQLLAGKPEWTDVDITFEAKSDSTGTWGVVFRHQVLSQGNTTDNPSTPAISLYYQVTLSSTEATLEFLTTTGSRLAIASKPGEYPAGEWQRLRISAIGDHIQIWLFENQLFDIQNVQQATSNRFVVVKALESGSVLDNPALGSIIPISEPTQQNPDIKAAITQRALLPVRSLQGKVGLYADHASIRFRNLAIRDAVLHRISFMTSAFNRFTDLVSSFGEPTDLSNITWVDRELSTDALAEAVYEFTLAQVDLRDELINREEFEAIRLKLRNAKAQHDEGFRALAQEMNIPLYDPPPTHLQVYQLFSGSEPDSSLIGFWFRSPESLDLKRQLSEGARKAGAAMESVGRTELSLRGENAGSNSVLLATNSTPSPGTASTPYRMAANVDATEVLIYKATPTADHQFAEFQLQFSYTRDYGDESQITDHRYDRLVEQQSGESRAESPRPLRWSLR